MVTSAPLGASSYIPPGTQLNGTYEIDAPLARGGMGEVYRGHNIQTGDEVAIKVIKADFAQSDAAMGLFRREASALSRLNHDAIVRYFGFAVDQTLQRPYLAMELIEGESIAQISKRAALPAENVRILARRVSLGLHAAHSLGITHRDISPDNIIVPANDVSNAKIIDFGIARSSRNVDGTIIGSGFAGKENYASPEQVGLFGNQVSAKSDMYSLALVLCEGLLGQPIKMGGSMAEIITKRQTVPDLSGIDPSLRPLLEAMLQPDPERRPASLLAVADLADEIGKKPVAIPTKAKAKAEPQAKPQPLPPPAKTRATAKAPAPAKAPGSGGWIIPGIAGLVLVLGTAGTWLALNPEILSQKSARPITPPSLNAGVPVLQPPLRPNPETAAAEPIPQTVTPVAAEPPPSTETTPVNPPRPATGPVVASLPTVSGPIQPPNGPKFYPPSQTDLAAVIPASGVSEMARFIREYRGGDCFAAIPISLSESAVTIEGAGQTFEQVDALTQSFKSAFKIDPDVGAWLISKDQCPLTSFLSKASVDPLLAPKIELGVDRLRSGQNLTGTIDTLPGQTLELLYISDEGEVQNITNIVRNSGKKSFNLRVERSGPAGEKPQLIVTIASSQPVQALRSTKPQRADKFFPAVLAELAAQGKSIGIAVRKFNLD